MDNQWTLGFEEAFRDLWQDFIAYVPDIVGAILILVLGWIIGAILGRIIAQIIRALHVDDALRKAGVDEVFQKGDIKLDSGRFVGGLVKWFVIIAAFITALGVLGLDAVEEFMSEVLLYIPNIIVAVLILLVAAVVGDVVKRVVVSSTRIANMDVSSNFLGSVAKWSIWIFGLFVALNQLGIGEELIQILFTGIVAGISIALGLAFGLGGQEHASKVLDRMKREVSRTQEGPDRM